MRMQICDVFVGSIRDTLLDCADPDLSLVPVVVQFGKFLKIIEDHCFYSAGQVDRLQNLESAIHNIFIVFLSLQFHGNNSARQGACFRGECFLFHLSITFFYFVLILLL